MKNYLEDNRKIFLWSTISVFLIGLFAHAYCFFDNNFSHDSMLEMDATYFSFGHKIELGRVFVPAYQTIFRGPVTFPWMVGVLMLLWISVSVFFIVKIYKIDNPVAIVLTAGIFTANLSVAATAATYMHDLDTYMFSMLCSVIAVYLWQKDYDSVNKKLCAYGLAVLCLVVSLGLYQSFLFEFATLVIIKSILDLLEGKKFATVLKNGLFAVGLIALAGGWYYLAMIWIQNASENAMAVDGYNTLDKVLEISISELPAYIYRTYLNWYTQLAFHPSAYPHWLINAIHKILLLLWIIKVVGTLIMKKVGKMESVLCLALCGLLPLVSNFIYILLQGRNHSLTSQPIWLFYLLILLLMPVRAANNPADKEQGIREWLTWGCYAMIGLLVYGNVQLANGLYLQKDIEHDAYVSLMTRVVDRIEQVDGYVAGETPVAFVGDFYRRGYLSQTIPGLQPYASIVGMDCNDLVATATPTHYQAFFDNVMGIEIECVWWGDWTGYQEMPCFPEKGSLVVHDGIVVVKLGEIDNEV